MREHGIAADDFALQRQHPQQLQRGLVLVGLGIHPELGQDRLDLRGVGGDQVDPGVSPSRLPRAVLPSMAMWGASLGPSRLWIHCPTRASKSVTSIRRKTRQ